MSHAAADLADRMAALRAQGIHSVLATFTDLNGGVKGKLVPLDLLPQAVAEGAGFSGPSITGTGLPRMGPRSEYMGRVLPQGLRPWPFMAGVAHAVCDGFAGGEQLDTCPRQVLKAQVERLRQRGWTLWAGIEPEFFLLRPVDGGWAVADAQDTLAKPSYDLRAIGRHFGLLDPAIAPVASGGARLRLLLVGGREVVRDGSLAGLDLAELGAMARAATAQLRRAA